MRGGNAHFVSARVDVISSISLVYQIAPDVDAIPAVCLGCRLRVQFNEARAMTGNTSFFRKKGGISCGVL
jgi:hypothetical protein